MAKELPPTSCNIGTKAFSLVEVTLALGIISVSLLSLLGLVPAGLGVLRDSMDQTVHAQIVQSITAELVSSDFASLGNATLAFDQEGRPMASLGDSAARYCATIQEADPSMPGLTEPEDVAQMHDHLKRIRIGISRANVSHAPVVWYAIQVAVR